MAGRPQFSCYRRCCFSARSSGWPLLRASWWSLHDTDLLASERQRWVGLAQYSDLLRDARFRRAFANTAVFALMVVPVQTLLAFLLALWVNRPERAWRWLRSAFFVPTVMAMPALAVLWTMLYQPAQGDEMGLVNAALSGIGLAPRAWLHDPCARAARTCFHVRVAGRRSSDAGLSGGPSVRAERRSRSGVAGRRERISAHAARDGAGVAQHDRVRRQRHDHSVVAALRAALRHDARRARRSHRARSFRSCTS